MICTGIYIPVETMASVENVELLAAYMELFISDEGTLNHEFKEIETLIKERFGYHLNLRYFDSELQETVDIPSYTFKLLLINESYFYSHLRH